MNQTQNLIEEKKVEILTHVHKKYTDHEYVMMGEMNTFMEDLEILMRADEREKFIREPSLTTTLLYEAIEPEIRNKVIDECIEEVDGIDAVDFDKLEIRATLEALKDKQ